MAHMAKCILNSSDTPFRLTMFITFAAGLPFFRGSKRCERICNIISKCYYLSLLIGVVHGSIVAASYPDKREDALLIILLLIVAFTVYFFLRKNAQMIEGVLRGIADYLSEKNMITIARKDVISNVAYIGIIVISLSGAVAGIVMYKHTFRKEMEGIGVHLGSDLAFMLFSFVGFVYYMKSVYSIIACSIQIYTITMVMFECLAENLKNAIKRTLAEGITSERISQTRTQLRQYWDMKRRADQLLNVFPFIWLVYLFLTNSLVLTKVIANWHTADEDATFLFASVAFSMLVIVTLAAKWHLFMAPDLTMDECMALTFSLTDPRLTKKRTIRDAELEQEIATLHLEMANAPNTYSTILGTTRFNFEILISYIGALVNFAVMVINIRMALKI